MARLDLRRSNRSPQQKEAFVTRAISSSSGLAQEGSTAMDHRRRLRFHRSSGNVHSFAPYALRKSPTGARGTTAGEIFAAAATARS